MDKIEKIRQEIERRKKYESENYHDRKADGRPNDGWTESLAIMGVLEELLSFIDTLSEEPDKSLEEEMDEFFETMPVLEHENIFDCTFQNIAHHFAEWGAEYLSDTTKMIDKSLEEEAGECKNRTYESEN